MEVHYRNLCVRIKCPLYSTKDLMTEMAIFFFCFSLPPLAIEFCWYSVFSASHFMSTKVVFWCQVWKHMPFVVFVQSWMWSDSYGRCGMCCWTDINVSGMEIILTKGLQCCNTFSLLNTQLELQYEKKRTEWMMFICCYMEHATVWSHAHKHT